MAGADPVVRNVASTNDRAGSFRLEASHGAARALWSMPASRERPRSRVPLLEPVFADLMAELPKPPGEGRGSRCLNQDGDPDPPRAVSGSADPRAAGPTRLLRRAHSCRSSIRARWSRWLTWAAAGMGARLREGFWSARYLSIQGSISSIRSARAQGVLSTSEARALRRRKTTSSKRRSRRGRAIR
jgi:hypothetical protein